MAGAEGTSGGCCGSYRGGPGERRGGLGRAGQCGGQSAGMLVYFAGGACRQLTSTCTVSLLKQAGEWRRPVEVREAVGGALHVVISDVRRPGSWRDSHGCQGVSGVWVVLGPQLGRMAPGVGARGGRALGVSLGLHCLGPRRPQRPEGWCGQALLPAVTQATSPEQRGAAAWNNGVGNNNDKSSLFSAGPVPGSLFIS